MHKMQPQQHAHYLRLWRFIRNCHWVKKPSHDSPLNFFFSSFFSSVSERDRTQQFDPLLRVNAPALSHQYKHQVFSPLARTIAMCALARLYWCERSSTLDAINVCENLHLHSNVARLANVLLNATKNGNGQWDQLAHHRLQVYNNNGAPFTMSWAKKRTVNIDGYTEGQKTEDGRSEKWVRARGTSTRSNGRSKAHHAQSYVNILYAKRRFSCLQRTLWIWIVL